MNDLGKTIAKHRKEHKIKQSELALKLEYYDIFVKPNTVSAWESGLSIPNSKQLLAICEILNIYDIYTEFVNPNPINPFRNLNETGVAKVMDYIHLLEKSGEYKTADIIPIHILEPRYHNEELIWIEQTEQLEDGEIGIFYLDGNAYVKKFQNNENGTYLVSLNKKYDPIPVTENNSFKIFGRVLS